jgi:L-threonylcarbamoyladenylate synthase
MYLSSVIAYYTGVLSRLGYGPFYSRALDALISHKQRSADKGLILITSYIEQFVFILNDVTYHQFKSVQHTCPGDVTWTAFANKLILFSMFGNHSGVAIHVSNHPIVMSLCNINDGPIVSKSANTQGHRAAET